MEHRFRCIAASCGAEFPLADDMNTCPRCGGLLDVIYAFDREAAARWPVLWSERRRSIRKPDSSGVWRFRELIPFLSEREAAEFVTTLGEGNTPLLDSPVAARFAGLDAIRFKHQGFNPTGSFKDNGMTCGVTRARMLGKRLVGCVSTGNTSASMAAYASYAGLTPLVFIPRGEIALGKLAQALEYGAATFQLDANFDQILKLLFATAAELGLYLLNSVNPFRLEGQKTIMAELLEQCGWRAPDWIVLPGGNLGNVSAFGKGLREMHELGLIRRLPRLAVIQAEGAAPLHHLWHHPSGGAAAQAEGLRHLELQPVEHPQTLATAIKIGAPVSWPKAVRELRASGGVCEAVSEQEIADAKATIGRAGIGCEPASAATLAGARKLAAAGVMQRDADVVAILTGHLLKDPDYILRYHAGELECGGRPLESRYANRPRVLAADARELARAIQQVIADK
jgi:threonine synthase